MTEYGHISLAPRDDIVAGSKVTLTFTFTVGSLGMKESGSLRITTPNDSWEWPRVPLPRYFQHGWERGGIDDGYVSYAPSNVRAELNSESDAWMYLDVEERHCAGELAVHWPQRDFDSGHTRHIIATVRDGDLNPGDVITIIYGDTSWGGDGVEAQRVAPTDKDAFRAYVDVTGEREFVELAGDEVKVRVIPGPPAQFNVVAPAIVRPNEPFDIRVSDMDEFRNRPHTPFEGEVRVATSRPQISLSGSADFTAERNNRHMIVGVKAHAAGVYRLTVEPSNGSWRSLSNPIWCTNRDLNVYFGDLHCHGMWHSDSIGTPDENYEYGRDVADLDFMGMTDSSGCYKEGWIDTQEAANRHYDPGRFVTFKGYEHGGNWGHRNVIFRDCDIESTLDDLSRDRPEALFEYYRGRNDVISIPHHTKWRTNWDYYDPELEPIVEVYSCWGSGVEYDDPLWDNSVFPNSGVYSALARRYRFGFIGSGDSHAGMPGRSYPTDREWCTARKSGFACVYAPELTREAIFDALRARQCYATTGARIILQFSVAGTMMGGEVEVTDPSEARVIRIHAIGTDNIRMLKIVKNNEPLFIRSTSGDEEYFEYYDTTDAHDGDFYYVRVVQDDEETAWSSPVWLNVRS